jgi:hypothetical protein
MINWLRGIIQRFRANCFTTNTRLDQDERADKSYDQPEERRQRQMAVCNPCLFFSLIFFLDNTAGK